jgi:hypothetical protein
LTNNAFSYDLARAVQNGSLGDFNFRPTWLPDPIPNVGNNIGGNLFSDRYGSPTNNFQLPEYGGRGGGTSNLQASNDQNIIPAAYRTTDSFSPYPGDMNLTPSQEGMLKNIYGRADADTWQDFQQDYGTTPPTYDFGQSPSGTIVH